MCFFQGLGSAAENQGDPRRAWNPGGRVQEDASEKEEKTLSRLFGNVANSSLLKIDHFFALFKNSVSFNGNEKQGSLKESWYRPNLAGVGQFFKVNLFLVIDSRCFMGEFHYK